MKNKTTLYLTQAAMIAALYVLLTYLASLFGLASYEIQVRFSEALTILPFFTSAAIPGLTIGCLLSNLLTGAILPDILFGSLATLLGALGTWALRPFRRKVLAPIPPILANTLIVPFILAYGYQFPGAIWYFMLTVGAGEVISCGVLGLLLAIPLEKQKRIFQFHDQK